MGFPKPDVPSPNFQETEVAKPGGTVSALNGTGTPTTAVSGTVAVHPGMINTLRANVAKPPVRLTIAVTVYGTGAGELAGSVNRWRMVRPVVNATRPSPNDHLTASQDASEASI